MGFGVRGSRSSGANASRFPPLDPVREAGARTDKSLFNTGVLVATFHRAAPARCGAFAEARRVVAGDGGVMLNQSPRARKVQKRWRAW
jgi:hypothetical protein